jgi:peptide/nickel transport system ATP-binding protein
MHAGHVVEAGPTADILTAARHPYTRRLIASMPQGKSDLAELLPIPGGLPDLRADLPPCRYSARCDRHDAACDAAPLPRVTVAPRHSVACRYPA